MVSQEVLVESLRLAGRIDELHQELYVVREQLEAAHLKCGQLKIALDDACAQSDEYRKRLAVFVGDTSLVETARAVKAQIVNASEQLGEFESDDVMLSLSRALAHIDSVVDVLSHGGEK